VLVAIYVTERFSKAARRAIRAVPQAPFTALHELEVPNAFELLVGRGLISRAQCRAVQAHLREDVESGRLIRISLDLERMFADACELSRAHNAKRLTRSLDLLHVAAAHQTTCAKFVSADDRQLAVARATGLKIVDIKRRARRRESAP
jgi:predicted nucleic acid-binding protein